MLKKLYLLNKETKRFPFFYSLNPTKLRPSLPTELAERELPSLKKVSPKIFLQSLETLFCSQHENFPHNIFWDLDYIAKVLASQTSEKNLKKLTERLCFLNETYGTKGVLNFSYTHDFIYGFDWFRWREKDFKNRETASPFGDDFIRYLEKRALELNELIKKNDQKYHKLKENEPRNPFEFKRNPEYEIKLHLALAANDSIPLKIWNRNPFEESSHQIDYTKQREAYSLKLGLSKPSTNST